MTMAKRVFFTFHYADILRVNVVRNHWVTKKSQTAAGFFDASIWEEAKKESDLALKRMINNAVQGTSVSCVLIGSDTFSRPWVRYELFRSVEKHNILIGVHINKIKTPNENTKVKGPNPYDHLAVEVSQDGNYGAPKVYGGQRWVSFSKIDRLSFSSPFNPDFRGKTVKLSEFSSIYDWNSDNGYDNFSEWIK